ncbi:MAG: PEP-CTERM system histidine kinase PrsK [Novosphingobium sp.]|nr:PEP-CTERM system histidine kinase PrsK [Novosphingobium sp.]
MGSGFHGIWQLAGLGLQVGGAVGAATLAAWLAGRRERFGDAGTVVVAALILTAAWCICVAALGDTAMETALAEAMRNLAWLMTVYRLFAAGGRPDTRGPVRLVVFVLALVEIMQFGVGVLASRVQISPEASAITFEFMVLFRLMVTVGALVLVHNLYAAASGASRKGLRWPAAGLGVLWAFDLNLYTIAYLGGAWPVQFAAARGFAVIVLVALMTIGATKDRDALQLRPSRTVTFQTFSLLVIGVYLVSMVTIAQWLAYAGGDFAQFMGLGFLTLASVLAILVLPSRKLRGWLRVTLTKHLFQHRYDYRAEWLRFTRTIGKTGPESPPLGERVVKAVADISESPAGLLLAPSDHGELVLAARWQWPEIEVPAIAMSSRTVSFFEREKFVADLDDIRDGRVENSEDMRLPEWLVDHPRAWAMVPLIHFEQLVGIIVLARPQVTRRLDWEDFDLLRVVGQQLASYLAEHSGQEALAESSRFDDFNRRIAFVMHDIKNLASQLSLLARNAEHHAEKPEFRKDMLVTLRNSSDKLNALLARLSRYGGNVVEKLGEVSAGEVAQAAVDRFKGCHPVTLVECHECKVMGNADALEQVLVHLIQNGIDASDANSPVFVSLSCDGLKASIEIVDSGCGMSPDFVRNRLFKPFVSSKQSGFGIGAFEARELVRAMRGRLEVESREGLGSRFVIRLPLAAASTLFETFTNTEQREAS